MVAQACVTMSQGAHAPLRQVLPCPDMRQALRAHSACACAHMLWSRREEPKPEAATEGEEAADVPAAAPLLQRVARLMLEGARVEEGGLPSGPCCPPPTHSASQVGVGGCDPAHVQHVPHTQTYM